MARKISVFGSIALFFILFGILASANGLNTPNSGFQSNFPYIEQSLLSSSRYTEKEVKDPEKYQVYLDDYTLHFTEEDLQAMNYIRYGETEELILYFHPDSFSVIIHNKITDYQWSSNGEFQKPEEKLTDTKTGIQVDYVISTNISRNFLTKNLLSEKAKVQHKQLSGQEGVEAAVNFEQLGFEFVIQLYIENGSFTVRLDSENVQEKLPRYQLIAIRLFPYFGAAREDRMPGYLFIPDGAGALVRFRNQYPSDYYLAKYYGEDYGYVSNPGTRMPLTIPVFGIVHDTDKNGFLGIIENGDQIADLGAYFWGYQSGKYFRISPSFNYREFYTNVIDKSERGSATVSEFINDVDIQIRYQFLSNDEADYVGMANRYKEYLEEKNILTPQEKKTQDIPLALDFLMGELEPSFLGSRYVTMTTPDQALTIYQDLLQEGIGNQKLNLLGWSVSGLFDTAPYRVKFAKRTNEYLEFIDNVNKDGNDIYLYADYVSASSASRRTKNSDMARRMSKVKMEVIEETYFEDPNYINFLYPEASKNFALQDQNDFSEMGVSKLHFSHLGNTIFSYYDSQVRYHREDSLKYYQEIAQTYQKSGFTRPNAYMFAYADNYFNIPLYNSQHHYFTDLVPFLQIVLKGNIDYFSQYLNFNSLGRDQILNLIDFGVNPNYILTFEDTTKMQYTKAKRFYSTKFASFRSDILEQYRYMNQALREVYSEKILDRTILDPGIVKVTYSNNRVIYINYSSEPYSVDDIIIPEKDYLVL